MIVEPINDTDCLGQLTTFARELAPSTLVRLVAQRLGTREDVIMWLQSLPQADDHGDEHVRLHQCDVPQRTRLVSRRSQLRRAIVRRADVARRDRSEDAARARDRRQTASSHGPRRAVRRPLARGRSVSAPEREPEFQWGDLLTGTHQYVGKPILKFYLGDAGGKVADALGDQEDKLVGQETKRSSPKKSPRPRPPARNAPSRSPSRQQPKPQPAAPAARRAAGALRLRAAHRSGGEPSKRNQPPSGEEEKMPRKKKSRVVRAVPPSDGAAARRYVQAAGRDGAWCTRRASRKRNASGGALVEKAGSTFIPVLGGLAGGTAAVIATQKWNAHPGLVAAGAAAAGIAAMTMGKQPWLRQAGAGAVVGAAVVGAVPHIVGAFDKHAPRRRAAASRSRRRVHRMAEGDGFVTRGELNDALGKLADSHKETQKQQTCDLLTALRDEIRKVVAEGPNGPGLPASA